MAGRRGLGASLWAWLNKPDAVAYLQRAMEDERAKAEAAAKELQRRESGAAHDLAVERCSHRDTRTKLAAAERELVKLREVYATHLGNHADLVARFAEVVKEKAEVATAATTAGERDFRVAIEATLDAGTYLGLAESYAAENDALRRLIDNARNQLDLAG